MKCSGCCKHNHDMNEGLSVWMHHALLSNYEAKKSSNANALLLKYSNVLQTIC
jgi:hypothetical protein